MKVRVKAPFFDGTVHKKGEVYNAKRFLPEYMELVEEQKTEKVEKAVKVDTRKTTRTKKG